MKKTGLILLSLLSFNSYSFSEFTSLMCRAEDGTSIEVYAQQGSKKTDRWERHVVVSSNVLDPIPKSSELLISGLQKDSFGIVSAFNVLHIDSRKPVFEIFDGMLKYSNSNEESKITYCEITDF